MGFFDIFKTADMSAGLERFARTDGAALIDVRTPEEYRQGHIPGSRSLPLDRLDSVRAALPDTSTPIFAYCLSGARSGQAVSELRSMGYQNVYNIGGIGGYRGKVER